MKNAIDPIQNDLEQITEPIQNVLRGGLMFGGFGRFVGFDDFNALINQAAILKVNAVGFEFFKHCVLVNIIQQ